MFVRGSSVAEALGAVICLLEILEFGTLLTWHGFPRYLMFCLWEEDPVINGVSSLVGKFIASSSFLDTSLHQNIRGVCECWAPSFEGSTLIT